MLDWIVALLTEVLQKVAAGTASDLEQRLHQRFVAPNDEFDPSKANDVEAWRDKLQPDRPWQDTGQPLPLVGQIYNLLLRPENAPETSGISPPRYRHTLANLARNLDIIVPETDPATGQPITGYSYHLALWRQLAALAARGDATGRSEQLLTALFGLGERLRWPNFDPDQRYGDLMLVNPKSQMVPVEGWIGTNVHSLLGQVFRVGRIDVSKSLDSFVVEHSRVQGNDIGSAVATDVVTRLHKDVRATAGMKLHAKLYRDQGAEGRFVRFKPRMAQSQRTGFPTPAKQAVLNVPESLLDLLDAAPRTTGPGPEGRLLHPGMPRRSILCTELYRPEEVFPERFSEAPAAPAHFQAVYIVTVVLQPIRLTNADATLFRMTLRERPHHVDWKFLGPVLAGLAHQTSGRQPQIWVSQAIDAGEDPVTGFVEIADRVKSITGSDDPVTFQAVLADEDKAMAGLLARAASRQAALSDPQKGGISFVDLVLRVQSHLDPAKLEGASATAIDEEPFTHLVTLKPELADTPPYFVLPHRFERAVSVSVQRYAERVHVLLTPPPFAADMSDSGFEDRPVESHFANFNKLRVAIDNDSLPPFWLTWPDALGPLPTPAEQPPGDKPWQVAPERKFDGPHFSYWLEHHFDQEIRERTAKVEVGRYVSYQLAGEPWLFTGTVEHQYSYRLPLRSDQALVLGKGNELRHVAELRSRSRLAEERQDVDLKAAEVLLRPLLSFDHLPVDRDKPERLELRFNKRFVQLLLEEYDNKTTEDGRPLPDDAREPQPAKLRPLYEALGDLMAAVDDQGGEAELILERWNFNNQLMGAFSESQRTDSSEPNSAVRYPDVTGHLERVEVGRLDLADLSVPLQPLRDLLAENFFEFENRLRAIVGTGPVQENDAWLLLSLPLSRSPDSLWSWDEAGEPGDPVHATTNVIRLGLRLRRPPANVIPAGFVDAQFLPMEIDSRVYEEIRWLRNDDFDSLAGAAAAELKALLDPAAAPRSRLLEHSAWLTSIELSKPLPPPAEGDTQLRGATLHRALFGEIYPYLNLPDNMRAPVSRVVDVSYVPHAFRPVQAHPAFGDVATTMQFIAFLLSIVDDVAAGRPLRQLALDDAGTTFDDAVAQRERVINLLN